MKILLFAAARQRIGQGTLELELALPATIHQVRTSLLERHPELTSLVASSRWAVDQRFVDDTATVTGAEEVALIPPVSGG